MGQLVYLGAVIECDRIQLSFGDLGEWFLCSCGVMHGHNENYLLFCILTQLYRLRSKNEVRSTISQYLFIFRI